jgi:acetolactate synthase I/III small subunit
VNKTVIELKVKNHPGVMSHICGLFARRAYNVGGILCLPMADNQYSQIWLQVDEQERLDQVIRQTNKLEDVVKVTCHTDVDHHVFVELERFFS